MAFECYYGVSVYCTLSHAITRRVGHDTQEPACQVRKWTRVCTWPVMSWIIQVLDGIQTEISTGQW